MPCVYILTGENTADKDAFLKDLIHSAIPSGKEKENSLSVFLADEVSAQEIIEKSGSSSFFSSISAVLVKECDQLNSETLAELAGYVKNPNTANILILEGRSIGKRLSAGHPFIKALKEGKKNIVQIEFKNPPPYKIDAWIAEKAAQRYQRIINKDSATLLQEYAGTDLLNLVSELEKLDIVLPPKKEITERDIREYTGNARLKKPWDIVHPVARKEVKNALVVLRDLYNYNTPALQILFQLNSHFLSLLKLKIFFEDKKELFSQAQSLFRGGFRTKEKFNELMIGILAESGYTKEPVSAGGIYARIVLPRVLDQISNFTLEQLRYIIRYLATIDFNLKTGGFKGSLTDMERVVLYIMFCDSVRTETFL